ncbi:MAG: hypothetical protein UU26_C0001G0002 [Candidatus Daviesbacteria bacterium GW2011_GWC1_40_9]|nr:MAG: hypothetical protein UU26_C0001G0002 [Candidatus Daviesbacteria bacterium GW2011_GWC1_40_9]
MASQDFLNYSLGTGFLILVGFASYSFYNLSQTFKESTSILTKIDDITKDVESLKDVIKKGRVLIRPYQQKTKKAAEIFDVNVSAESLLTMIQNGQTKSLDITPI